MYVLLPWCWSIDCMHTQKCISCKHVEPLLNFFHGLYLLNMEKSHFYHNGAIFRVLIGRELCSIRRYRPWKGCDGGAICFFALVSTFWTNLHWLPPQESLLAALVGWKNPCCFSWPDCWLPLGLQGGGLYVMYIFLHIYVILMDVSTVLSPYAVSICDTSGPEYKDYEYGGIGRQIKTSSSLLNFVS